MFTYQIRANGEFLCFIKSANDAQAVEKFLGYARREPIDLDSTLSLVGLTPEGKQQILYTVRPDELLRNS